MNTANSLIQFCHAIFKFYMVQTLPLSFCVYFLLHIKTTKLHVPELTWSTWKLNADAFLSTSKRKEQICLIVV